MTWSHRRTALLIGVCLVWLCSAESTLAAGRSRDETSASAARDHLRPFTVADSIAMRHFTIPYEGAPNDAPMSPDGKKFFVVIERGDVENNLREYTLLVYDVAQLSASIRKLTFKTSSNRPGISQASWLDDRQISLLGEAIGGVPQVYILDCRSGRAKQLTSQPEGVASFAISKDQRTLAYYQLWGVELPGDKEKETHGFAITDENLSELTSGAWRRHVFVSRLHIKEISTGRIRALEPQMSDYMEAPPIWLSPNGRFAIVEQAPGFIPSTWADYDDPLIKQRAQEVLTHRAGQGANSGLREITLVDTGTGKIRPLLDAPGSPETGTSVVWSTDSRSAVVLGTYLPLNVQDYEELKERREHAVIADVDVVSGNARRVIDLPSQAWSFIQPGPMPDTFEITGWESTLAADVINKLPTRIFRHENGEWVEEKVNLPKRQKPKFALREALDQWPVLVSIDETGSETLVLDPNPHFNKFRFGRREVINWTGKLGETLTGGLVYPTEYKPGMRFPLVIQTHGFSAKEYLLDGAFTSAVAAEELANRGVAVLQLPVSDREKSSGCDRGLASQSQIESAIDYLDSRGLIDRDRVGLVGFSVTGFAVRYALMNSTYHFRAATSVEGSGWSYWVYVATGNTAAFMAQEECPYGGPPWNGNWDRWMKKSISFNYDKIHTPLRLESDGNGPSEGAEVLYEWENYVALKRLHKPVELIYVTHGAHPVVKPWDRLTSQQGNVDWMLFWLKGEEDPDTAKSEQYERWHELKRLQDAGDNKENSVVPGN